MWDWLRRLFHGRDKKLPLSVGALPSLSLSAAAGALTPIAVSPQVTQGAALLRAWSGSAMPGKLTPRISVASGSDVSSVGGGSLAASGGSAPPAVLSVSRDATTNMDPYSRDMEWDSMWRMNDNRILIAHGGYHSPGVRQNIIRCYDPSSHVWTTLQPNDFGATRWDATDNQAQWFIPSLGTAGVLVYSYCAVYDVGSATFLASNVGTNPVTNYIEMFDTYSLGHLQGLNGATEWCQAIDVGIQTQDAEGGNGPGPNNFWGWLEKNPNYPSTSTKPLRLRTFSPPTVLYDANFHPGDTGPHGGWMNCRNMSCCVGEYMYLGGGFTWNSTLTAKRGNKRFVKIHLPTLYAATTDAEKNSAVTFLADCPTESYYGALSYDVARQAILFVRGTSGVSTEWGGNGADSSHGCNELYRYDILTNTWTDVTPSLTNQPSWCRYYLGGWMAVYDAATDAHYVREGSCIDQSDLAKYNQYNGGAVTDSGAYAGRMYKIQFNDTAPSRFSTVQHGGAQPFNQVFNGVKHIALAYDSVRDELIQMGGDFNPGAVLVPFTPLHPTNNPADPYYNATIDPSTAYNGETYLPYPSLPIQFGVSWNASLKRFRWNSAGGKRDIWMCHPRQDGAVLNWQNIQPTFSAYGEEQGPPYPDQTWWWQRTAGGRNEWYVAPGAVRWAQYYMDYGMLPEFGGIPSNANPGLPNNDNYTFQWLRPGWRRTTAKRLVYVNDLTDATTQFPINTNPGDGSKFCAYDPVTDAAYSINDNFEVMKWDCVTQDWQKFVLGVPAFDDDGRATNGNELSSGGSVMARVDRRIYALCGWFQSSTLPTRTYLAWFDIDTQARGLITCPFDIDEENFVANSPTFGNSNPEESGGVVALHRHLVCIRVYNARPAGHQCIWSYDVDRKRWTTGQTPNIETWSRAWVALPYDNTVMFFGDIEDGYESRTTVFKYRVF